MQTWCEDDSQQANSGVRDKLCADAGFKTAYVALRRYPSMYAPTADYSDAEIEECYAHVPHAEAPKTRVDDSYGGF